MYKAIVCKAARGRKTGRRAASNRLRGRSPKLISEIIAGKAPVKPRTALQFERALGMDASVWLGIESNYRLHLERQAEMGRGLSAGG